MAKLISLIFMLLCAAIVVEAQEKREFRLMVDPELDTSGLMAYLLPRFSLKTGRRAELVSDAVDLRIDRMRAGATLVIGREGRLFGLFAVTDNPAAAKFADWLVSDIGKTAIAAFVPQQGEAFAGAVQTVETKKKSFSGDAVLGAKLAETHCGRCHRVRADRAGMSIGSTPSFRALRALPDWVERFSAFYTLNPHPAFLRVADVTPPFDPAFPPAIHPVQLILTEVEAIQAYAASLEPADLGAAVKSN